MTKVYVNTVPRKGTVAVNGVSGAEGAEVTLPIGENRIDYTLLHSDKNLTGLCWISVR